MHCIFQQMHELCETIMCCQVRCLTMQLRFEAASQQNRVRLSKTSSAVKLEWSLPRSQSDERTVRTLERLRNGCTQRKGNFRCLDMQTRFSAPLRLAHSKAVNRQTVSAETYTACQCNVALQCAALSLSRQSCLRNGCSVY